jgi:uncharacterized membrane protein
MKTTWRTELPQWIVIAAMFAIAAWSWPHLPDRIPIHWNFKGEVDGYGNRFVGLLLIPLISVGLYLMFRLIYLIDPGRKNYASFATALSVIRMAILFMLAVVYGAAVLATFGHNVNMKTITCFSAGALLIVLGNFMGKIRPNWFVGVRTPWTLSSRLSWNKTHRLAGWLFVLMGLLMVITGAVQTPWIFVTVLIFYGICLAWMIVYSYLVYRHDPDRISPAGTAPSND